MNNLITIGIDIGGTHITTGLVDLQSRTILQASLFRTRLNTQAPLEEILTIWSEIIKKTAAFGSGKLRLGMAMPGPFDYEEGISLMVGQNKYDSFYDLNIKQLLAERLNINKEDILMMNDACCFLKGEVYGGAAREYSDVIGLTLGTGLGSAKYASSFTYDSELWCHPFFDSIVEDYLSSGWFVNRFKELTGLSIKDVKELSSYVDSNVSAKIVFEEFGTNLGLFLVEFINMENPEVVVLGGNIAKAYNLFIPNTLAVLEKKSINIPILKAILGEDAAIIGAASLWANNKEYV
ncbi:MAG: hypothetical protein JWN56_1888 [Sphingobacteriales bacterium]|nr:hypothetical protein [Sphingobacteriales bacterium]